MVEPRKSSIQNARRPTLREQFAPLMNHGKVTPFTLDLPKSENHLNLNFDEESMATSSRLTLNNIRSPRTDHQENFFLLNRPKYNDSPDVTVNS